MAHSLLETDNVRYSDFSGFFNEAVKRQKKLSSASNMYNGDMWDRGKGYIGPRPTESDINSSIIFKNIQRTFTSRNVIAEVVDRQVDALLSRSPDWKIYDKTKVLEDPTRVRASRAPRPGDSSQLSSEAFRTEDSTTANPKIMEAEALLNYIWTNADIASAMKGAFTERLVTGRGVLRIHIAKKFFRKQVTDMQEAAKYIRIEHIDSPEAVILDDDGEKLSAIQLTLANNNRVIELSFVDDDDKTYIATIDKNGTLGTGDIELHTDEQISDVIKRLKVVAEVSTPFSLDERITADEILGRPLVSESMLQNNRALNLDLSLGVGVLVESGYAEMVVTNVALETTTENDPDHPGATRDVAKGLKRGAGIINNLIGEQTVDAEGRTYFEKPTVEFKEPTPLTSFIQGENLYYRQILCEAKQLHILLTDKADTTGESKIQSRQDFVKKSQRYKPEIDRQGTWVLNTVLNLVASAAGDDGYFSDIEAVFDSQVFAGELSSAEKDIVISRYEHGLVSRSTAMVLLGTEDPLLEIDLVKQDEAQKLDLQVRRLEATAKFGNMSQNGQPPASEQQKQATEARTKAVVKR